MNQWTRRLRSRWVAAAGGMCLALLSGAAGANTIAYDVSLPTSLALEAFSYTPTDVGMRSAFYVDEATFSVPQFDPALGSLNSIELVLSGSLTYEVFTSGSGVIEPSQIATASVQVGYGASLLLSDPGGPWQIVLDSYETTALGSCERVPGQTTNCDGYETWYEDFGVTGVITDGYGDAFTQFIGTGTTDAVVLDLYLYDMLDEFLLDNLSNGDATVSVYLNTADLFLSYDYTPVPVPPALALFLPGLLSLLGSARRLRH